MKKSIFLIITLLLVLSIGSGIFVSYAANNDLGDDANNATPNVAGNATNDETANKDITCANTVRAIGQKEWDDYANFLNDYFLSADPSSSQIDVAMKRYRFFRQAVDDAFNENAFANVNGNINTVLTEYSLCKSVRDELLNSGSRLLSLQALESANSKRTFKIIDGWKQINENMRDFSTEFSFVFPQVFQTMDSKLPCYVRSCVTL